MQITNTFSVPVPVDTVWKTLLDVKQVAPCMPGASVDRVDGDDVFGSVKVKLGPIMMRYQGTLTFAERDEAAHRAVLSARAQETRGAGSVNATVTASLAPAGDGTEVTVVTDLDITGKPAQFGRGVMTDVSRHLVGQFAQNLAREFESGRLGDTPAGVPAADTGETPSAATGPAPVDSLNALSLLKEPARRIVPPLLVGLLIGLLVGRRRGRHAREVPRCPVDVPPAK